jgi:hypothetical protein
MQKLEPRKPYLYDGTGIIGICNFCGKRDIVVPTGTLHLCMDCVKRGEWHYNGGNPIINEFGMQSRIQIIKGYGRCDICGVFAVGYIAAVEGWACFRCLWTKIAKRHDALRPEGFRLV